MNLKKNKIGIIKRCGHFERIFPLNENCIEFSKFFECQRRNNEILWNYLLTKQNLNNFLKSFSDKKIDDINLKTKRKSRA